MGKFILRLLLVGSFVAVPLWANAESLCVNPTQSIGIYSPHYKLEGSLRIFEILKAGHAVKTGFVCQTKNDIVCIDGLCNEPGIAYWAIYVNGDYLHFNAESLIGPLDRLEVKYQPQAVFQEGI